MEDKIMATNVKNERISIVENIALSCGIIWGYNIPEMYRYDQYPNPYSSNWFSRDESVRLYEWTPEEGFRRLWLPSNRTQVCAGHDGWGDVEYWDKDLASKLTSGVYILMFETSDEDYIGRNSSSYCVFEI